MGAGGAGGEGGDKNTYCYCNGASYGEMIGCDDDDCEIEWVSFERFFFFPLSPLLPSSIHLPSSSTLSFHLLSLHLLPPSLPRPNTSH